MKKAKFHNKYCPIQIFRELQIMAIANLNSKVQLITGKLISVQFGSLSIA